jgi:hypothetical protein
MVRVSLEPTIESIAAFSKLIDKQGVRPAPKQQIADYFEDVDKLCGPSPEPGTAVAEIRAAADALRDVLNICDPYLIAVRALELGEYRFWPGAFKADASTSKGRLNFAQKSAELRNKADAEVLNTAS